MHKYNKYACKHMRAHTRMHMHMHMCVQAIDCDLDCLVPIVWIAHNEHLQSIVCSQ